MTGKPEVDQSQADLSVPIHDPNLDYFRIADGAGWRCRG